MSDHVKVGDRIRFSVGLLKQIYEMPEHTSVLVQVAEIRTESSDWSKTLVLNRVDVAADQDTL